MRQQAPRCQADGDGGGPGSVSRPGFRGVVPVKVRVSCLCACLLFSASCDVKAPTDAASSSVADAMNADDSGLGVDAVVPVDANRQPDASEDAAPDTSSLVCTGRPIPEGLACVAQAAHLASACGGQGGVVFDGGHCVAARGAVCGETDRGAFDSLEECGVTCAAAGECDLLAFAIDSEWQAPPQFCREQPYECPLMGVERRDRIPTSCAVWDAFNAGVVYSTTHPFPEQWDVLYSLTLAKPVLGRVFCEERR